MNKLSIPYQMTCPRPNFSDSIRPRKRSRPLPFPAITPSPTPTPSPTLTKSTRINSSLPDEDQKTGNQEWQRIAEEYKSEAERWRARALDQLVVEDLEDRWTNLRTEVGEIDFPISQFGESVEMGQADDLTWACYVRRSRRCQMERNITELQRQVRNLERTVERLKLKSVSRFDPYFGSIEVDVDDDTLSPFLTTQVAHHYVRRAEEVECTGFVNQLFPGLATSLVKDDIDFEGGIPPTPISLISDIFPDLDPVPDPDSTDNTDIITIGIGLPAHQISTVDEKIRKIKPSPHQLERLGDWARNVLVVLEANEDGEKMDHLEWTWELIKQFQSCLDSQKSVD